jgi:hypothetical protein
MITTTLSSLRSNFAAIFPVPPNRRLVTSLL